MAEINRISESSEVSIPLKNIISILVAVSMATWGFFALTERVNNLEHSIEIMQMDVTNNNEFRVRWPRGELGSLPADQRQDLIIESLEKRLLQLDAIQRELNGYRVQIELLIERYDSLKK
jgi:hypothetical protein